MARTPPAGRAAGTAGRDAAGREAAAGLQFAPPALETAVLPGQPGGKAALRLALAQLAEQDPLISLRQDGPGQDLMVSLYGEVQKEVIQATLAADFGLDVTFRESTVICIERPVGTGEAAEFIGTPPNPFLATVGLRVRPGAAGSGVTFRLGIELGALPLAFLKAIEETVRLTLRQGLRGWQVTDTEVTLTRSGYWPRQSHAHGTFDASMSSTAGDFRQLTPLVLMAALAQAGTRVHEPVHAVPARGAGRRVRAGPAGARPPARDVAAAGAEGAGLPAGGRDPGRRGLRSRAVAARADPRRGRARI